MNSWERRIGYFFDKRLDTIAVSGGPPKVICEVSGGRGGCWSPDGTILFTPANGGVFRVRAASEVPARVATLDKTQNEAGQ